MYWLNLKPTCGRERQLEGIAGAKARGVYKGRKASIDSAKIKKMKIEGMGPSAIAKALKIGRASVYRALSANNGASEFLRRAPMHSFARPSGRKKSSESMLIFGKALYKRRPPRKLPTCCDDPQGPSSERKRQALQSR